jgi:hypothetical protein
MPSKIPFDVGAGLRCCFDEFSPWAAWATREQVAEGTWHYPVHFYPGVYLLARFGVAAPTGPADYLAPEIVYVGHGRRLGRRWKQFDQSAFHAKPGHSGGWSYGKRYGGKAKTLYVAALPMWFGAHDSESAEDWTHAYRLYVERRIIWEITVAKGGKHGLLNDKARARTKRGNNEATS